MLLLRGPPCHKGKQNRAQQNNQISTFIKEASHGSPWDPHWLVTIPWAPRSGIPVERTRKGVLTSQKKGQSFLGWLGFFHDLDLQFWRSWLAIECLSGKIPTLDDYSTINEFWDMTSRWSYWVVSWEITGLFSLVKYIHWEHIIVIHWINSCFNLEHRGTKRALS